MSQVLETLRMSMTWLLEEYNDYLKRKDARQITFDQFCDEYDSKWELN